jgi:hypothetical protein
MVDRTSAGEATTGLCEARVAHIYRIVYFRFHGLPCSLHDFQKNIQAILHNSQLLRIKTACKALFTDDLFLFQFLVAPTPFFGK